MIIVKPNYYYDFKCLMGECPSSCCEKWQVVVDRGALNFYNSLKGEFGKRLRDEISLVDGDYCFKVHNGRCSFLNDKNLCDIHIQLGKDKMARTCKKYPDFTVEINTVRLCGQSISCPYVAEKILKFKDKPEFVVQGNDEQDDYDKTLFDAFLQFIKIAQDRQISIEERMDKILSKGSEFQNHLWENFGGEEAVVAKVKKTPADWCSTLNSLELLTKEGGELIDKISLFAQKCAKEDRESFSEYIKEQEYQYEQILVYFLYRYFFEYWKEGDILLPLRFAVFCTRVIYFSGEMIYKEKCELSFCDQLKLCYIFGKEIEHSKENLGIIFEDLALGIL